MLHDTQNTCLSHVLPPSTHLIRTAPRATNPLAAVRVCVACRRCGSHPATHLAHVTAMSTHRITPPLTRCALLCRRSLTPLAHHERPVLWRGYYSSPSCQCSCPHDRSNKCANGHSRRCGGVILALFHPGVKLRQDVMQLVETQHQRLWSLDAGFVDIIPISCTIPAFSCFESPQEEGMV
jgi:hypothetical protein